MKDVDWRAVSPDVLRDLLYSEYQMKEASMRAQSEFWTTSGYDSDQMYSVAEALSQIYNNNPSNPLVELMLAILKQVRPQQGPFTWYWHEDDNLRDVPDAYYCISQADLYMDERHSSPYDNPWETGKGSGLSGHMILNIRGHGDGKAFKCHDLFKWTYRTHNFLQHITPLIKTLGKGKEMKLEVQYLRRPRTHQFTVRPQEVVISSILMKVGDLYLCSNFRDASYIEASCHRINHSVVFINNMALHTKNHRSAMFITSANTLEFNFLWEDNLKQLMLEDSPTPEEMLMIEMAGYDKDEFWLDNIKDFDRLNIKQFNLKESTECHMKNRPVFKI